MLFEIKAEFRGIVKLAHDSVFVEIFVEEVWWSPSPNAVTFEAPHVVVLDEEEAVVFEVFEAESNLVVNCFHAFVWTRQFSRFVDFD